MMYAVVSSGGKPDEACMFTMMMEKQLVPRLLEMAK